MSDPRQHFMAAICAEPQEDTHRLVFADWLTENGNESERARAEFIKIQVELAKWGPYPRKKGSGILIRHGQGYYDATQREDDNEQPFQVGDRVDYLSVLAFSKRRHIMRRGLLVTKIDDVKGQTILKKDAYSAKYPVHLLVRQQELLDDYWSRWVHESLDDMAYDLGVATSGIGTSFKCSLYNERHGEDGHLQINFQRGFINKVIAKAEDFVPHGDFLIKNEPIEVVKLTTLLDWNQQWGRGKHAVAWIEGEYDPRLFTMKELLKFPNSMQIAERLCRLRWPTVREWQLCGQLNLDNDLLNTELGAV